MHLEATRKPIRYRLKTGEEVTLRPGVPMELPDHAATQLLKKAPDQVRRIGSDLTIQPGDSITWQRADGSQHTGTVDFLHTDPDGRVWAYYSLPDGGSGAVNTKYLTT